MIYFDNAATSWPKPPAVRAALEEYFGEAGGNPGRSGHRMSIAAARLVENTRESLAELFHVDDPSRIVFTHNATHALNLALHGLLKPGAHVVTTAVEHNSVMRPLRHLEAAGVELTVVPCSRDGLPDLDQVRGALRPSTKLLVATHASNVIGSILPIADLAALARERGALSLIDASQTAGCVPLDLATLDVDLLAFTGHKGLLGPTGTGGLYIREGITMEPLIRGGTGSASALEQQPDFLPDAYESGTPNVAGIAGLGAAVHFLNRTGVDCVLQHERALVARFIRGAAAIPEITVYGTQDVERRCGLVSFTLAGMAPSEVSLLLDESFGILARPGLHCSPAAHRTLGTFPNGTVRFSFGWFNTLEEVDRALTALREIAVWAGKAMEA